MDRPDTVTELAVAAGRGDRTALAEFIRQTQSDVWCFVAHLAGRDSADDLTQETFLRMLTALPRFEGRSSARTWLLAIARRVVVDRRRFESSRPILVGGPDRLEAATVEGPEVWSPIGVRSVLDALEPARREALVLTRVLGFSYAEAAEIAGVAVGTIRSRVARAREQLVGESVPAQISP